MGSSSAPRETLRRNLDLAWQRIWLPKNLALKIIKWGTQFSSGWFSRSCSGSPVLLHIYHEEGESAYTVYTAETKHHSVCAALSNQAVPAEFPWLTKFISCSYLRYIYLICKSILGVMWGRLETSRNLQELSRSAEHLPSVWKHDVCRAQSLWLQWNEEYQVTRDRARPPLGYVL